LTLETYSEGGKGREGEREGRKDKEKGKGRGGERGMEGKAFPLL